MRAWILPGYTGIESLRLGEMPEPTAGDKQVVLQVAFAALNPADRYLSIGQYPAKPTFPHVLGRDGVGKVASIGAGVTGMKVGDMRVILRSDVGVNRPGTLAEKVVVDAAYTTDVPAGWSLEQAAAAPLVYVTAWQALTQWSDLPAKAVVLVTGASGGVGVASVQLAHAMGHTVVALSRNKEKSEKLRELGAAIILNPSDATWRDQLKAQLGEKRVDLAIDNVGGENFNHVLEVLGMHGRISVVGRLAGPVPAFNTAALFFRRLRVGGVAIGSYTNEESVTAWKNVLEILARAKAQPLIDRVFPFEEVPAAFARLGEGPMGKVVVRVRGG